ncbi:hypothetical protein F5050DRAFT_1716173 [Lentinula boryana]|uniref:CsbD-like domain-containing protein n=1 Tax=Lentinula boryana TaxID=40481 RepID=A0ABQ8PYT0_9AGAR|nr:hypothetical protein F5050DRAFT_1716173 [Lentinula boryana]
MPFGLHNNNTNDHTSRDTALGAGAGGLAGHEGHQGHTARDAAMGGFAGREAGHHGGGTASGTHGNRDGLIAGAAVGHGHGHGMRDAAIGGAGGEILGRHQGRNADNAYTNDAYGGSPMAGGGAGVGAGAGAGAAGGGIPNNTNNPSKMHGKVEEIEGKVERGLGKVTGNPSLGIKGENKIIAGQREQAAVGGHRQADALEAQAAAHRNHADALHPSGARY